MVERCGAFSGWAAVGVDVPGVAVGKVEVGDVLAVDLSLGVDVGEVGGNGVAVEADGGGMSGEGD